MKPENPKILPHQTPRSTRTRNTPPNAPPHTIPINNNLELPLIISNPKKNLEKTSINMMNTTPSSVSVKKKMKNKIRFSDEQIRSLETMFDCETRIEPKKKLQLARELGLQPRQVAIWFQNKRARWKSKQLERDYGILLANHNNLVSRFEVLKKEKQSLLIQLQKLKEIQEKAGRKESEVGNGGDENKKSETEVKPNLLERHVFSDEEENSERFGGDCFIRFEEENEMLKMVKEAGVADSPEDWGSLDSEDLLNPPTTSYDWWDFWS